MLYRSSRREATFHTRRLGIQSLEARTLLATFTVSTLADESDGNFTDGDHSLREAIERANLTAEADTINFKAGLAGTITLNGTGLVISEDLTINGPGASKVSVDGGGAVRCFSLSNDSDPVFATISGLTITGGRASFAGTARRLVVGASQKWPGAVRSGLGR